MPHLWNDIYVVTESEIVPIWYNCRATLRSEIHRHRDLPYGIKKVCSGGNGRQLLVAYDSLDHEIKNALGDPRRPDHLMERFYQMEPDAVRYFQNYRFEDGSPLSLQHKEEYITNACMLAACERLKAARERERKTKGGSCKGIMRTICQDAHGFNKILEQKHKVRHTLPASEKRFKDTFRGFLKPFENEKYNYASLISGKLKNQNSRKVTDPVMQFLNDLFGEKYTKPTRTEISRQYDGFLQGYIEVINPETAELYDPKEFKALSESTIVNYLGAWEERIGTYSKRSGDRQKLMGQFKPYHSLKRPEYSGSIISVDDRQPPFEYQKGERPWFYNGIDLGSEAIICWVYGKSKEGIIIEFYRQLLRNYHKWNMNLPLEIECEMSLNSSYTNTFLRPGMMFDKVRIEANNARGKRIERYYGQLRYGNEKQREGWIARPFAQRESNQAGPTNKIIIPFNNIVEGCLRDIEDWNNSPHSIYADKTRFEIFRERQHPGLYPTNWKGLLPYLGFATKSSVKTGILKLQGKEFLLGDNGEVATGDKLINLMKHVEDEDVTVYWLDDNKENVIKAVIYLGDMCICEAVPKPVYHRASAERTAEDLEARETMSAYVATIDGYMNRKRNSLNDLVVIDNRPKTLNRKFVIDELPTRYVEEPTDTIPEILEEPPAEDEMIENIPTSKDFVTKLKDRI